jgi:hypothetical protein
MVYFNSRPRVPAIAIIIVIVIVIETMAGCNFRSRD